MFFLSLFSCMIFSQPQPSVKGCSLYAKITDCSEALLINEYVNNTEYVITESGFIQIDCFESGMECPGYQTFDLYLNDSLIDNAQQFTLNRAGHYKVTDWWAGQVEFSVKVVPDPVQPHDPYFVMTGDGDLNVIISAVYEIVPYSYMVYDLNGIIVQQDNGVLYDGENVVHVSLNGLSHGCYFINLINHNIPYSHKFVKM